MQVKTLNMNTSNEPTRVANMSDGASQRRQFFRRVASASAAASSTSANEPDRPPGRSVSDFVMAYSRKKPAENVAAQASSTIAAESEPKRQQVSGSFFAKIPAGRQRSTAAAASESEPKRRQVKGSSMFAAMAARQNPPKESEPEPPKASVDFTKALVEEEAARAKFLGQSSTARSHEGSKKRPWYNNQRRAAMKACRLAAQKTDTERRANRNRLMSLVASSCGCSRDNCFNQFQPVKEDLVQLVQLFSEQAKGVRDTIILKVVGKGLLLVLGKSMSRKCMCKLFSLGKVRVNSAALGKLRADLRLNSSRSGEKRALPTPALKKCHLYLSTLYGRLGETLPHRFHGKFCKRKGRRHQGVDAYGSSSSDEETSPCQSRLIRSLSCDLDLLKMAWYFFNILESTVWKI